jgi:hypothetical protein
MPICPLTAHDSIVIPDISLLVTTFSMQSWPLQSRATSVTSMGNLRKIWNPATM